jgi:serine/threonine protein kinase
LPIANCRLPIWSAGIRQSVIGNRQLAIGNLIMTPERWQQIDQLFKAALACEPAQREQFLADKCTGDEPLRLEVESLLSSLDEAEGFIEAPAGDLAAELLGAHRSTYEPGQQNQNYRIVRQLGSGGMGEVYLAEDIRLHRKVALKILPPHFTVNPDRVRRFEREARAASALNHPNIVTIYEIGQSNTTHFIATEFVDGETLREHMSRQRISIDEVLNIGTQIVSALQAAHQAGIVHRDIKPENIMLRRDGIVKVLDFGLAKLGPEELPIHSEAPTNPMVHTNPGVVMGTVGYMSPEQARATAVDARADIWSIGVVMYEMVAGRTPFAGETQSQIIVSIIEHDPVSLSINSEVPDELQRIVGKCLVKNRERRYQRVEDLLVDLKRLKQRLEVDAAIGSTAEPGKTRDDDAAIRIHKPMATDEIAVAQTGSRLVHFARGLKSSRRRQWLMASVLVFVAVITPVAYWRYKLTNTANPVRSTDKPANTTSPIRTLAIIPFENQTQDSDSAYLARAIPETLGTYLSKPGVKVLMRSPVNGTVVDMQRELANTLGVVAIMTGRVARRGDNIVVSVEVVEAKTRSRIWRQQYNRKLTHVITVQLEVADEIVQRVREMAFGQFIIGLSPSTRAQAND